MTSTVGEIMVRREQAFRWWLDSVPTAEIARRLGVCSRTVQRDLSKASEEWRKSNKAETEAYIAACAARADDVRRKALEGFERSREDAETLRIELDARGEKTTKTITPQAGDPRFLKIALEAQDRIHRLLGLVRDDPQATTNVIGAITVNYVSDAFPGPARKPDIIDAAIAKDGHGDDHA